MGTYGGNAQWPGGNEWSDDDPPGGDRGYDVHHAGYGRQGYQEPGPQQHGYPEPGYQQVYGQPYAGYDQSVYYEQPGYQETAGHPGPPGYQEPAGTSRGRRSPLVPILASLAGVVLLGGVGFLGLRLLGDGDGASPTAVPSPDGASSAPSEGAGEQRVTATPIDGSGNEPVNPSSASASCQSAPSVDDAGHTTTFEPENALDHQPETAWRCEGAGGGELRFAFSEPTTVQDFGLIPGYAKVDPATGKNRFHQNHTVTEATWTFTLEDGQSLTITQLIADPSEEIAYMRLSAPQKVVSGTMKVTGTGNPSAERDFTPVSDIALHNDDNGPTE